MAVDIGYSGTKLFSPNAVACFPSFATPINGSLINLSAPDATSILYRDESGNVWRVGKAAQAPECRDNGYRSAAADQKRRRSVQKLGLVMVRWRCSH